MEIGALVLLFFIGILTILTESVDSINSFMTRLCKKLTGLDINELED